MSVCPCQLPLPPRQASVPAFQNSRIFMVSAALSPASVASPDTVPASSAAPSTNTTPRCGPMASQGSPVASRMPGSKAVASVSRTQIAVEKRQGRVAKTLPAPLTETMLLQAMSELPEGTRRATETCYQCFQVCHLASINFLSPPLYFFCLSFHLLCCGDMLPVFPGLPSAFLFSTAGCLRTVSVEWGRTIPTSRVSDHVFTCCVRRTTSSRPRTSPRSCGQFQTNPVRWFGFFPRPRKSTRRPSRLPMRRLAILLPCTSLCVSSTHLPQAGT